MSAITRKGSGVYVCNPDILQITRNDRFTDDSIRSLLNLLEVRRAIEAEIAAVAAVRRNLGQLDEIESAFREIARAVASGSDGVEEDARFHRSIAVATGNPYWVRFIELFATPIRSAVTILRANEARMDDFARQAMVEHEKILSAIVASDSEAAKKAASEHMEHAAERIRKADREFWQSKGFEIATLLKTS